MPLNKFAKIYEEKVKGQSRGDAANLNINRLLETLTDDQVTELLAEEEVGAFWSAAGVDSPPTDRDEIMAEIEGLEETVQQKFLKFFGE